MQPETAFYGSPYIRRDNESLADAVEQAAGLLRGMGATGSAGTASTSAAAAPRPALLAAALLPVALCLLLG